MTAACPPAVAQPDPDQLHLRVEAELVRTAFRDAIYGAPFGIVVALLYAFAIHTAFPVPTVLGWLAFALTANLARLASRWAYFRQPVPGNGTDRWRLQFTVTSAFAGASWGIAGWVFYTPQDSIYRVMIVLVIAGLTTGASRLLAPIACANLLYVYLAVGPLIARILVNVETRSDVLGIMCVLYLAYMSVAARQQLSTLRDTIRLGYENTALVGSLGTAKVQAERLNRELSAEIARREVVETELRAASESALAGSRAKSEFLATMSHEIRTPMNGIIGMLRIVRDSPLAPSQREQLDTASASADTLLELLSDILDFSKIEAGHLQFEHLAFAPAAVARSVCDLLRPRASAKGLTLGLELAASVPVAVIGDPTRLRQVLFNLVGNAVKFTASGQIELRVHVVELRPTNTLLRFTVTDSGIGMDADTLGRLFRPFSQADSSMTRRFGGTGLGLAICKKLVEAMHGTLEAQSKPEAGSVFTFTLPFERGANLAPPPAPNEFVMPQLRGRILVVEDEKTNQRVIGHFLKKMGLESELAEDGNSAVELALRESWAAVLMDCQLPGIDGLEATRRIRARLGGRSLPIIALTANASTEDRAACLAAGMDEFLTKPVRIELLAAMLQRHLPGA